MSVQLILQLAKCIRLIMALLLITTNCLGQSANQLLVELIKKGRNAYDSSDFQGAKQLYTQAIANNDKFALAYAERADTEIQLKQYAEARADCQRAIQLDPSNYFAYFIQGDVLVRRREGNEAVISLQKAIELRPSYGPAYQVRAKAYELIKQYNAAILDYNQAMQLMPDKAAILQKERDAILPLIAGALSKADQNDVLQKPKVIVQPPKLVWTSPNALNFPDGYSLTDNTLDIELTISASATKEQLLHNVVVLVDNKPYADKMGEKRLKQPAKQADFTFGHSLELTPGRHTIVVQVQLPGQPPASSAALTVIVPEQGKPDLYVLAIGVKSDLQFTQHDADGIWQLLQKQEGKLFGHIYAQSLTGEETTAGELRTNLEVFGQKPVKDKDLVIFFFSGHGTLDSENDLRLLGYNYRPEAPRTTTLSYRNDVVGILSNMPGKKLILLDACHSGQAVSPKSGERSVPFQLANAQKILAETPPGMVIITSSSSTEKSYEDPVWQNGAFTKALQEAINSGKADTNHDGIIYVRELFSFLQRDVPQKVSSVKQARQTPSMRMDTQDFPLFGVTDMPK